MQGGRRLAKCSMLHAIQSLLLVDKLVLVLEIKTLAQVSHRYYRAEKPVRRPKIVTREGIQKSLNRHSAHVLQTCMLVLHDSWVLIQVLALFPSNGVAPHYVCVSLRRYGVQAWTSSAVSFFLSQWLLHYRDHAIHELGADSAIRTLPFCFLSLYLEIASGHDFRPGYWSLSQSSCV